MIDVSTSDRSRPGKPNPRSHEAILHRVGHIVLIASAAMLTLAAVEMMFSVFMFYDDEGYVLTSLRNFTLHGNLYREVYSQYGPFPYVLYYALHALGLPFTHTAGRIVTLVFWSGTAVACAALVGRSTRHLSAQLAVLAAVFIYLWVMCNEPTHPGGLIVGIVALLACFGHRWIETDRLSTWAWLAGACIAALALTKINIGAFAALTCLGWLSLHHTHASVRRWAPAILLIGVTALPFALMRPLLDATWVQTYALMFACAGFSAVGAVALGASPRGGWPLLGRGALGAALVFVPVLGVMFLRGTSGADLLEGVLLRPMRHPVHFNLNFAWPAGLLPAAFASVGAFVLAWLLHRRWRTGVDLAVACLRLVATLALATVILRFPAISPDNLVLAFAGAALWLFIWPLAGEPPAAVAARSWLGLLFLGQCLHAFPVRGSQSAWGTFLAIPLVALGAWQTVAWLAVRFPPGEPARRFGRFALAVPILCFAGFTAWQMLQVGERHRIGRDLELPGAEHIRLPESSTALFQILTLNAAAHGDMLFSLPGMYSLNLWSGLPTPTLVNVTHWFSLLDRPQHEAIIRSLESHPRAVVIVQRQHLNFIKNLGFYTPNPLSAYIEKNFAPAFTLDDFELHVRKGRVIAPLLIADVLERTGAVPGQPADGTDTLLRFNVLLPDGTAVASAEVVNTLQPDSLLLRMDGSTARVELTPVNLRGEAIGPIAPAAWPFIPKGTNRVSLYFDRQGRRFPANTTIVVLRDAAGTVIALVRLRP